MDKIFLRQLEVDAVIGIWDWEQRIRQAVRIDVEMSCDVRRAAATDSIETALNYKIVAKRLVEFIRGSRFRECLNYKIVAKRLVEFIRGSRFRLVETLAEACARIVVREFGVEWVRISIAKPAAIRGAREVGVIIERTRADFDA